MFKTLLTTAAVITLSTSTLFAAAHAPAANIHTMEVAGVNIYTDAKGMTLYTFDKDKAGKSNCNGGCAVNWPPLDANAKATGSDDFSVITRADGSKQWAFKGMALYTWFKDKKPGDITGDGVKGVWHIVKP